jgi:hypothetical protein
VSLPPHKFEHPPCRCYHSVYEMKTHGSVVISSGITFISNAKIRQAVHKLRHVAGQMDGQAVGQTDRHYYPQYVPACCAENAQQLTSRSSPFVSPLNRDSAILDPMMRTILTQRTHKKRTVHCVYLKTDRKDRTSVWGRKWTTQKKLSKDNTETKLSGRNQSPTFLWIHTQHIILPGQHRRHRVQTIKLFLIYSLTREHVFEPWPSKRLLIALCFF